MIPEINGKTILLYKNEERQSIETCRKVLEECGVIAIACSDPTYCIDCGCVIARDEVQCAECRLREMCEDQKFHADYEEED